MSLLPELGSLSANKDVTKQLASIRSYLSQLQDSMESELMNIGFDNLNGDLKKKFSSMSDDIKVVGDSLNEYVPNVYLNENYMTAGAIQSNFVSTAYLQANYITALEIDADYVKTSVLETDYVKTSYLTANYITASAISASYATVLALDAAVARIGAIEANYITANYITASVITSQFISTNSALFDRINVTELRISNARKTATLPLSWHSVNSGGNTIYFLGTTTSPQ